jgi:hypothetical protein
MASLKRFLKDKAYIRIPLNLSPTNHFEVEALVNGVSGRFIVDTGASNTCIDLNRSMYFQLVSEVSETKAAGAGGVGLETEVSKNNQLIIGQWKKKKTPIVLFSMVHVNQALEAHNVAPVDGIIGADILKKGKGIIDYNKQVLYLKK